MAELRNKTIIIVGGNSGIGLGIARAALEKSSNVVIIGRSEEKLARAQSTLAASERVRTMIADMTKEKDLAAMFDAVGPFDHLVSTAGAPPPGEPIAATDIDSVRAFIDNKLVGAVMLAKHAVRWLKVGGSITFTSGINKDRPPTPGGAVVAAIAGSFSNLAHALALELAPTRVNVVSPGWVDTPMFSELAGRAKAGLFTDMAARLPAGRIAAPRDIAPAYIYAMESDFTTGETIHIDGGQRLI